MFLYSSSLRIQNDVRYSGVACDPGEALVALSCLRFAEE